MKLHEAILRVNKDPTNEDSVDCSELCHECHVEFTDYYGLEDFGIRSYWLSNWYCTDTWVGLRVMFLDESPVGLIYQSARKSSTEYSWLSKELYFAVHDKLVEIMGNISDEQIMIVDLNEDLGKGYRINYGAELLTDEVIIEATGEKATVVEKYRGYDEIDKWDVLKIKTATETKVVKTDDILIPWKVKHDPE